MIEMQKGADGRMNMEQFNIEDVTTLDQATGIMEHYHLDPFFNYINAEVLSAEQFKANPKNFTKAYM